jgi:alkanesulfonate monooxygenase SsuD/methylene tetrahydromethanopterin reductase-like flavin-dependent oxidoreductase (luciferase family)
MVSAPQFHLFLPQLRLTPDELVLRARTAEACGFGGVALMDHLAPPLAPEQPAYEAMVTATWLAAHTSRLTIGHLVLCDALRHPALLAKQAVSLDHVSAGRFELGMGWGSVPEELDSIEMGASPARRAARLGESLAVLKALWSGERVDFDGEFHQIRGAVQRPRPLTAIPLVIGGASRRSLDLAARFADWWNAPVYALDRLDELRAEVGSARVSVQTMIGFVRSDQSRDEVAAIVARRFGDGPLRPVVGTAAQLVDYFGCLVDRGVERCYVWFADFAEPATLEEFGAAFVSPPQPSVGPKLKGGSCDGDA